MWPTSHHRFKGACTPECWPFHPSQVYKDGNHKPEMALALTDFEALCGFVEAAQLTAALEATPELRGIVGDAMSALVASTGDTALRWAGC